MAQERTDLEISRLYLNVAIECFNKAAIEEHADGAGVFRRMGRRYISEAELYGATLALPQPARDAMVTVPRLSAEQHRALAMLATAGHNGATQSLLIARGFSGAMISGFVNRGLATLTPEKVRGGGKLIDVTKVRITAAGRDALAES